MTDEYPAVIPMVAFESGGPEKRYTAEHPEGHRWMFMER
jgi:hypothetical protein